jgi:hypothetical protein
MFLTNGIMTLKRRESEIIFFIIAFCLFYLSGSLKKYITKEYSIKGKQKIIVSVIISIFSTMILVISYYMASLNYKNEGFWDVSEYAKCKGGPYMWQGDSPEAIKCRELANTKEGRCGISSYNCPSGYNGTPKIPFYYTPLSNDEWKNERCNDYEKFNCIEHGLCGMDKQVE